LLASRKGYKKNPVTPLYHLSTIATTITIVIIITITITIIITITITITNYDQMQECLYMGNLDSKRDWGHAKDYVIAMWMMLQVRPAYVIKFLVLWCDVVGTCERL
jgi:hypothetical protein